MYPHAIRILRHKEYVRQEFAPLSEDDPMYEPGSSATPDFEKDFDMPVEQQFSEFPE